MTQRWIRAMIALVCRYKTALEPSFENIYLADCKGHPSRVGKEKISIWKRQ